MPRKATTKAAPKRTPAVDPWAARHEQYMRAKLEAAGATAGEIDEFAAQWLADDWPHDEKVVLMAMGDARLRAEVERTRDQNLHATTTEAEEHAQISLRGEEKRLDDLHAEAARTSALDPSDVLAWCGNDVERITAALDVETSHPHPRQQLVDDLESLLA